MGDDIGEALRCTIDELAATRGEFGAMVVCEQRSALTNHAASHTTGDTQGRAQGSTTCERARDRS